MNFQCAIELTGGDTLLKQHSIVTVVATKNGIEIDRFCATIEDLLICDFHNSRISEHTAYLKLKSHLNKVHQ
jgi:hypothetical protein